MSLFVDQLYQKSTKKIIKNYQWHKKKNDIPNLIYITRSTIIVEKIQQRPIFVYILVNPPGNHRKKDEALPGQYNGEGQFSFGNLSLPLSASFSHFYHWWIYNNHFPNNNNYNEIKFPYGFNLIPTPPPHHHFSFFFRRVIVYIHVGLRFQSCYYVGSEFRSQ